MQTLFIISGTLFIGFIILLILILRMQQKLKNIMRGKSGSSLEKVITENNKTLQKHIKQLEKIQQSISDLEKDSLKNIQNVNVLRFNPFKETGGNQSFALALTDKEKNGVVISSLYVRDRMNVFAKQITNGTSSHTLTAEEEQVINQ